MNPLKKIISMQKLSYGVGYIYIHWHYWFLTHFYQDNNIPYRISLKGSRTAYGLAYDSAKIKAWYVAPNVTGCLEGVHLWKDLHLYELERLYKRT